MQKQRAAARAEKQAKEDEAAKAARGQHEVSKLLRRARKKATEG